MHFSLDFQLPGDPSRCGDEPFDLPAGWLFQAWNQPWFELPIELWELVT